MSVDIFLLPVDEEMFSKTVVSPINNKNLPSDIGAQARVWGVRDSQMNRNFYDSMSSDDVLLFYLNKQYVALGKVGKKFTDEEFSETYWGEIQANLLFEINEFEQFEVGVKIINDIFDYSPDFIPQSFRRVSNQAYREMYYELGSIREFENYIRENDSQSSNTID